MHALAVSGMRREQQILGGGVSGTSGRPGCNMAVSELYSYDRHVAVDGG